MGEAEASNEEKKGSLSEGAPDQDFASPNEVTGDHADQAATPANCGRANVVLESVLGQTDCLVEAWRVLSSRLTSETVGDNFMWSVKGEGLKGGMLTSRDKPLTEELLEAQQTAADEGSAEIGAFL